MPDHPDLKVHHHDRLLGMPTWAVEKRDDVPPIPDDSDVAAWTAEVAAAR